MDDFEQSIFAALPGRTKQLLEMTRPLNLRQMAFLVGYACSVCPEAVEDGMAALFRAELNGFEK